MKQIQDKELAIALKAEGLSYSEIAIKMNRTRNSVITLCLYKRKTMCNKRGPKFTLNKSQKLNIKRTISKLKDKKEKVNSTKLKNECDLSVSIWTIQRHLKRQGLKYKRMTSKIYLSKMHKEKRIDIINGWITENHPWEKTVFSDEKRFSLDGPDDWRTYVTKNEEFTRQQRQCGGGSIMVWLMALPNGLLSYQIIPGKFNSNAYIELLKSSVVPILKLNFGDDFWLQEDNAPVHKSSKVKQFMKSSSIKILAWPARSPDLNIVEDIWNIISQKLYDGPQFLNVTQLTQKLKIVINNINRYDREKVLSLFKSIRGRLCTVLYKRGCLYNK